MERCVLDSPAKHIDLLPKLRLAKRRSLSGGFDVDELMGQFD
jgi:hypothetical protein